MGKLLFVNSGTEIARNFVAKLLRDIGYELDEIDTASWSPGDRAEQALVALIGPQQPARAHIPGEPRAKPPGFRKALIFVEIGALGKGEVPQILSRLTTISAHSMIVAFSTKDYNVAKKLSGKNVSVSLLPLHYLMKPGARSLLRDYSTLIMRTRKRELVNRIARLFLQVGISTRILVYGDSERELPFAAINVVGDDAEAFVERSLLGIITEEDFEGYLLASRLYYDGKPLIICDAELREISYGDVRESLIRRMPKCEEYGILREVLSIYRDLEYLRRISVEPLPRDKYEGAVKIIKEFLEDV